MDVKTEGEIVEAMKRLMRGRTTFIIAHRPSVLAHCQQLLHIERGAVVALRPVVPGADGVGAMLAADSATFQRSPAHL